MDVAPLEFSLLTINHIRVSMISAMQSIFPFQIPFFSQADEKEKSPFDKFNQLSELAHYLTSDTSDLSQWITWKKEIKDFIDKYANDGHEIDQFLTDITAWAIKRDPLKVSAVIAEMVSLDALQKGVKHQQSGSAAPFTNVFDWAAEQAELCPDPNDHTIERQLGSEWRKFRPIMMYFIPNMIDLFLGAFNFLDMRKKYTTLWEKHLLLEIVYKFFVVPYFIYKILQPFIKEAAKVYIATALVIVAIGIMVSIYERWLRPLPDEIVNCTNLDKLMEDGVIEHKVGQSKEIAQLIAALQIDANVLLIGHSGEGKTSLVHHLIELKHAGELPEDLKDIAMFDVDCGMLISSVTYGYSELITQIKEQCEGFDGKILLHFDQFYEIASNAEAFQAFKKRFLEDKPHPKIIVSLSFDEFKEIQKLDIDGSFRRRVVPILVESSDDEQNFLIARQLVHCAATDIPVIEEAIEEVVKLSKEEDYLPEIGRPARVIKILTDCFGKCRATFSPHYVSETLSEAQQTLQVLKLQAVNDGKPAPDLLKKIREKKAEIAKLEEELEEQRSQAKKIKALMENQKKLNEKRYELTHHLARVETGNIKKDDDEILDENKPSPFIKDRPKKKALSQDAISQETQVQYLWMYFYAIDAMKQLVQDEIDKVRRELPVQVDKELIAQVYAEKKKIESNLYSDHKQDNLEKPSRKPDSVPLDEWVGDLYGS